MGIRALEFYSGIGGLHRALKLSRPDSEVICAFDWDQNACIVYEENCGSGIAKKTDISTLQASHLQPFNANLWLLSPSCQPYTVLNPNAKGAADPRAKSFLHLIENVLPELVASGTAPKWILIENVAGFEASTTRLTLLNVLKCSDYNIVELLLTPLQFGIPNSRLRYYLLAKRKPHSFPRKPTGEEERCTLLWRHIPGMDVAWSDDRIHEDYTVRPIREYLDNDCGSTTHTETQNAVSDRVLLKWGRLFDIVTPRSRRSCCFTRGYTQLVERAGSILQENEELDTTEVFKDFLKAQTLEDHSRVESTTSDAIEILRPLRLRYFSPSELLRLFHFIPIVHGEHPGTSTSELPESTRHCATGLGDFVWPEGISNKTKYRLLGNSVNVEVVRKLIDFLLDGDLS